MKIWLMLLAFSLVGCNSGSSSKPSSKQDDVRCLCTPETQLELYSTEAFPPVKMSMTLNDNWTVVDECDEKPALKVERLSHSGKITGLLLRSLEMQLKIQIFDRGSDCKQRVLWFETPDAQKEITVLRSNHLEPELDKAVIHL